MDYSSIVGKVFGSTATLADKVQPSTGIPVFSEST